MTKLLLRLLVRVVILLAIPFSAAHSAERILFFHSDIQVNRDGTVDVTETIKVYAMGQDIKRGIYRDFPTIYRGEDGGYVQVGFTLREIFRDNVPDNYRQEQHSNGIRIYIGQKDYFLPQGEYEYTLRYQTSGQLGYFEGYDEIYWNVTGNGWDFPIEQASATVYLPQPVPGAIKTAAFVGAQGSTEQNVSMDQRNPREIFFQTRRRLNPREGLTVAVSFPKGYVDIMKPQPSAVPSGRNGEDRFLPWQKDDTILITIFCLIIALHFVCWVLVGIDESKGTIIPLYYPPKDFTPEAARYLMKMGYDQKILTVSILRLAVNGAIRIREEKKPLIGKSYTLQKTADFKDRVDYADWEWAQALMEDAPIVLEQKNYLILSNVIRLIKKKLNKSIDKIYFVSNRGYTALLGCVFVATYSVFILNVFGFEFSGLLFHLSWIILLVVHSLFNQWMKAPTLQGRKVMDKIEGFKMFLKATEQERLKWLEAPEKTPQLYEEYLPYAIALDVESQWANQFTGILENVTRRGYTPAWYMGSDPFNARNFSQDLGTSFTNAISSASQPPGSSSGSGGGGSSGGGGGGGGGGGW